MAHESRQPQYFATEPSAASRPRTVSLELPDLSLELHTDNGVFSADRIDPGTRILLVETTPDAARGTNPDTDEPRGDLVDLGAGYGPIALTLALRNPRRTVWAIEPNERARRLCTDNAVAAGVDDRVRVVAPEEVPTDLAVAGLYSNPPIRIGKLDLHRLLERWMGALTEGGEAWLVVQRHLGSDSLARWLADAGHEVRRVASRRGYRVLRVQRRLPPR